MKKIAIISSTAIVVLLSACTVEAPQSQPAQTNAPAPVQTNPPAPAISMEDAYIEALNQEYPEVVAIYGRRWAINFGFTICEAIDNDMTLADLAMYAVEYDVEPAMLGYITGLAVGAFCPGNEWFLGGYGA